MTQFEQWGVWVYSHAEPWINADGPQRELLLAPFGWFARLERDMISARTKSAMASRKALGKHMGRPKGSKDRGPRRARAKGGPLAPYLEEPSLDKGPLIGGGATTLSRSSLVKLLRAWLAVELGAAIVGLTLLVMLLPLTILAYPAVDGPGKFPTSGLRFFPSSI